MGKTFITILSHKEDKIIEVDSFFVLGCTREEDGLHVEGLVCLSGDLETKGSFYYVLLSELARLEDKYPHFVEIRKAYEAGELPRYADDMGSDGGDEDA